MASFKLLGASVVVALSLALVKAETHTVTFTNKSVITVHLRYNAELNFY
jgi:hypothetical protein